VEGWRIAANLVMPRMNIMGVNDFYWKKTQTSIAGFDQFLFLARTTVINHRTDTRHSMALPEREQKKT
jgi:hypothetical protein